MHFEQRVHEEDGEGGEGRGKKLEFSHTYYSSSFIFSGHPLTSVQTNTIIIHYSLKVKCLQRPNK